LRKRTTCSDDPADNLDRKLSVHCPCAYRRGIRPPDRPRHRRRTEAGITRYRSITARRQHLRRLRSPSAAGSRHSAHPPMAGPIINNDEVNIFRIVCSFPLHP
jgi:hypothetical protein